MRRAAISWSGGKDSYMALHMARERGFEIEYGIHMIVENVVSYHGPRELIMVQQAALGTAGIFTRTTWEKYEEDFIKTLESLRRRGVEAVVFGDIFIESHREWVERVCRKAGVEAVEPLWGINTGDLVRKAVDMGVRAIIIRTIDREPLVKYLGRVLDRETIEGLIESGIDPAGEYGEYHTIVLDAPLFRVGIEILGGRGETIEGRFGDKIYRYRIYIPTRYRIYNKYQARGSYLLTT